MSTAEAALVKDRLAFELTDDDRATLLGAFPAEKTLERRVFWMAQLHPVPGNPDTVALVQDARPLLAEQVVVGAP